MKSATVILSLAALAYASPMASRTVNKHGSSVATNDYDNGYPSPEPEPAYPSEPATPYDGSSNHGGSGSSRPSSDGGDNNSYPKGMTKCPNNFGFKYAIQASKFNNQLDPQFWTFLPSQYWKEKPITTGTTRRTVLDIGENDHSVTLWDGKRVKADNIVVNMRGFLYTPETGVYTFTSSSAVTGGVGFVWVNQQAAYSLYSRGLANVLQYPNSRRIATHTVHLKANQYVPIRVMYGHSTGNGHFDLEITSPSGNVLLGSNTGPDEEEVDTRYIIQTTCGQNFGHPWEQFKEFGAEI